MNPLVEKYLTGVHGNSANTGEDRSFGLQLTRSISAFVTDIVAVALNSAFAMLAPGIPPARAQGSIPASTLPTIAG